MEIKHRKIDTSTGIFRFMSTRFTNKVNTAPKYNEGTPSKQRKYGIVKESKRKKGGGAQYQWQWAGVQILSLFPISNY